MNLRKKRKRKMSNNWKRIEAGLYRRSLLGGSYGEVFRDVTGQCWNARIVVKHPSLKNGYNVNAPYMGIGTLKAAKGWVDAEAAEINVTVKNALSGTDIDIPLDTPYSCDPSNETYWSM